MKKLLLLILIGFAGFGFRLSVDDDVKKHALIIAIGNYPEETDWASISSLNDIKLIQDALTKQGFQDFTILKDEQATKKLIVSAIEKLTENVKKDDIVVVHFSSHGQQIMDDSNDELDGYDEAIVAYGAPARYDALYKGENHLRDEELGALLDKLRLKLGPAGDVLLFVDACHSGTPTRGPKNLEGTAKTRGGKAPFAPKGYMPNVKPGTEHGMLENRPFSNSNPQDFAPMVVLSAAQAGEVNYEYANYGSLSLAISRSLDNLSPNFTYRALFSRILKEMSLIAPKQNPAIEGSMDRELFGGKSVVQDKYYTIYSLRGDYINLNGGQLTGVFDDCKIGVYKAGTVNFEEAEMLASGTVTGAEGTWASVRLDKKLPGKKNDYWVFVTEKTFGDQSVSLSFDPGLAKDEIAAFKLQMQGFDLMKFDDTASDFRLDKENGKWQMIRLSNATMYKSNLSSSELKDVVKSYAQGRFIKGLDLEEPGINVSFELLPVVISRGEIKQELAIEDFTENGVISFSTRDKTVIKVTNHGKEEVYFNIIDIQPDGIINAIAPTAEEQASSFKIAAGASVILDGKYVEFGPPYGTEVFKIFASTEPLDFSPIISSRGERKASRSTINPIESLFQSSYHFGTRGGKAGTLSVDAEVTTSTFTFKITKP
jgi:metacaspase-1